MNHCMLLSSIAAPLAAFLFAGCAGAPGDAPADTSADDAELSSAHSLTCASHYTDATYAAGFHLTVGKTRARIVDASTEHPFTTYRGAFDATYEPTTSKYAGYVRYRFTPDLKDFPEADSMDLLVEPTIGTAGGTAYLRWQGPEGGNTETY